MSVLRSRGVSLEAPAAEQQPSASLDTGELPPAPALLGIGGYAPETVLSNAELEAMVETSDTWILERTGIRERRRGRADQTASVMGAAAARRALERAGSPTVDCIIACTASPDTLFPSVACLIQRRLGLGGAAAFDLGAACSGFVYGVTVADALIRGGHSTLVLVVATESMTSLVDYHDRATCVLFGDGAGAAVVGIGESGGLRASRLGADGAEAELIYYGPRADDPQSAPRIRMAGKGTFRIAVERMTETALALCADAGWRPEDVEHFVPHQANLRIIDAVAKRIGARPEQVIVNGDMFGNTSAASIPLALAEADAAGRLRRGDRVVGVAFGAGSTWGGIALEWALDPPAATPGA